MSVGAIIHVVSWACIVHLHSLHVGYMAKNLQRTIFQFFYLFVFFTTERIVMRCNMPMSVNIVMSVVDKTFIIADFDVSQLRITMRKIGSCSLDPCASYRWERIRYRLHELFLFRWYITYAYSHRTLSSSNDAYHIHHRPRFLFLTMSDVSCIRSSRCGREYPMWVCVMYTCLTF